MNEAVISDFYRGNWSKAVAEALASGSKKLFFPSGKYDFIEDEGFRRIAGISNHDSPGERTFAMPLSGKTGVEISGEDGTFLCFHGEIIPFLIEDCHKIMLRNMELDFAVPFYSQGEVIEAGDGFFVLDLPPELPWEIRQQELYIRNSRCWGWGEMERHGGMPPGKVLNCGTTPDKVTMTRISENRVRFSGDFRCLPTRGNFMVLRHHLRNVPAIFIHRSEDVTLSGVTLHHAGGMGVIAQSSSNLHLDQVMVTPGRGRAFSLTADAAHFVNCYGKIKIENCCFEQQFDDAVNIHGIYSKVTSCRGGKYLTVELIHSQQAGADVAVAGNRIVLLRQDTLEKVKEFTVLAVRQLDLKTFELELDKAMSQDLQPTESVVENLTWIPARVIIRNNIFRFNNPRGILVSSGEKILIERNFINVPHQAILINGDAHKWFESGAIGTVVIRNNVFSRCARSTANVPVIRIEPELNELKPNQIFHRNAIIHDNRFEECGTVHYRIRGVGRLKIRSSSEVSHE